MSSDSSQPFETTTLKEVQQRLVYLMHAYDCKSQNNAICDLAKCWKFTPLLIHIRACQMGTDCSVRRCASSKSLMSHFCGCDQFSCVYCELAHSCSDDRRFHFRLMIAARLKFVNDVVISSGYVSTKTIMFSVKSADQNTSAQPTAPLSNITTVLKQVQLRLHALRCKLEGRLNCPTPECEAMQDVLHHKLSCEEGSECATPHCWVSKLIFNHLNCCTDVQCSLCTCVHDQAVLIQNLQCAVPDNQKCLRKYPKSQVKK